MPEPTIEHKHTSLYAANLEKEVERLSLQVKLLKDANADLRKKDEEQKVQVSRLAGWLSDAEDRSLTAAAKIEELEAKVKGGHTAAEDAAFLRTLTDGEKVSKSWPDVVVNRVHAIADRYQKAVEAVRLHYDQRGDDRCWLDDLRLYHDVLGVGLDPYVTALPPECDMIESCRRYIRQRQSLDLAGTFPMPGDMTIAQLTAKLSDSESRDRAAAADARIAAAARHPQVRQALYYAQSQFAASGGSLAAINALIYALDVAETTAESSG